LQAAGIPAEGYMMGYQNAETSEELTSKNQALKQTAVTRTLTAFVQGKWEWRNTIGWQPTGAYATRSISTWAAIRRGMPIYVGLLFFVVAIVPLVMSTKAVVDQVVFKPLCEQYAPDFERFQHGSGNGNVATPYSPGRCWHKDGVNFTLQEVVGSSSVFIDTAGSILQVVVPLIIIVVIEIGGAMMWRGRRKAY
jgi:hypothetical protein